MYNKCTSVMEDVGFQSLMEYMKPGYTLPSRRHFVSPKSTTLWPHTHWRATGSWYTCHQFYNLYVEFECWAVSMFSLMALWNDKDFNLIKAVLHSQEFTGSHSASAISEAFEKNPQKTTSPQPWLSTNRD